jgi:AraC family transcriptional activator of pobA
MASEPNWQLALPIIEPLITPLGVQEWFVNPSFPLDVQFWVLNRERDIRLHRPSHFELTYMESGEVVYQLDRDRSLLRQGDLVVSNGNAYHRCCRTDTPKARRAVVMKFRSELILDGDLNGRDTKYLLPFALHSSGSLSIIPGTTGVPKRVFDLILQIHHAHSPEKRHQASMKTCLRLIVELLRNYYADVIPARTLNRVEGVLRDVQQVFHLVATRYQSGLTVDDAASLMGLTRWQFMHLFRAVTGQSFITYVNRYRIAKAQTLLVSTDRPIVEIGFEAGFCDQSYFGATFRRFLNTSPQAYRRLWTNQPAERTGEARSLTLHA